mgnify:CR=1 FL=1
MRSEEPGCPAKCDKVVRGRSGGEGEEGKRGLGGGVVGLGLVQGGGGRVIRPVALINFLAVLPKTDTEYSSEKFQITIFSHL